MKTTGNRQQVMATLDAQIERMQSIAVSYAILAAHYIKEDELRVVCGWCKKYGREPKVMREAKSPNAKVSHGMCEECSKDAFAEGGL